MSASVPCPNAVETLLPRITARARRLTQDRDAAQDLVQETILRLWQKLSAQTQIDDLESYAMIIMRNLATTGWRNREVTEELHEDQLSCAPTVFARLALDDLMRAIDTLPNDQAHLMRLVAHGETSPAALAKMTGVPAGTVMSRLGRARATLRRDLDLSATGSTARLI